MFRRVVTVLSVTTTLLMIAGPAWACGALIGRNGAVDLVRTTTLAAYHAGVEHYVTSFEFAGGGGEFGSIVPLPAIPTKVEKGGAWTLQRLVRETRPPVRLAAFAAQEGIAATKARVVLETRIDALDITVLEGGAFAVGEWAKENGFLLSPDTPEVLDFYASRSKIFMAARFDAEAARQRGQDLGDGTPIHLTIPVSNPWVPLRILALGKKSSEFIRADVYLLTDERPTLLPGPGDGFELIASRFASESLLGDLRSDRGMEWVPSSMWLSHLAIDVVAGDLDYDLAIDASGRDRPSRIAAGFELPKLPMTDLTLVGPEQRDDSEILEAIVWMGLVVVVGGSVFLAVRVLTS